MYFTLLFHDRCYSPDELLVLFDADKNLLKEKLIKLDQEHRSKDQEECQ